MRGYWILPGAGLGRGEASYHIHGPLIVLVGECVVDTGDARAETESYAGALVGLSALAQVVLEDVDLQAPSIDTEVGICVEARTARVEAERIADFGEVYVVFLLPVHAVPMALGAGVGVARWVSEAFLGGGRLPAI